MDKLIDPLYDMAAEKAKNDIMATRILLTRQYAPGNMAVEVRNLLNEKAGQSRAQELSEDDAKTDNPVGDVKLDETSAESDADGGNGGTADSSEGDSAAGGGAESDSEDATEISFDGLDVWVLDLSKAAELHLDEMTLLVWHSDEKPFTDLEELVLMWKNWQDALSAYRPIITPITARDWPAVKEWMKRKTDEVRRTQAEAKVDEDSEELSDGGVETGDADVEGGDGDAETKSRDLMGH